MYVDDVAVGRTEMPADSSEVQNIASQGALYIGGVPGNVNPSGKAASTEPLLGCISDLIVNQE